eukprot:10275942-Lingulodinium_polyedra.AAC.1
MMTCHMTDEPTLAMTARAELTTRPGARRAPLPQPSGLPTVAQAGPETDSMTRAATMRAMSTTRSGARRARHA